MKGLSENRSEKSGLFRLDLDLLLDDEDDFDFEGVGSICADRFLTYQTQEVASSN